MLKQNSLIVSKHLDSANLKSVTLSQTLKTFIKRLILVVNLGSDEVFVLKKYLLKVCKSCLVQFWINQQGSVFVVIVYREVRPILYHIYCQVFSLIPFLNSFKLNPLEFLYFLQIFSIKIAQIFRKIFNERIFDKGNFF